jgi:ABC-type transport system involved in cytochrome c biogenesis permease component
VAFPLMLLVFFAVAYPGASYRGVAMPQYIAPVFAVYGIAVTTYVNVPQLVAAARESGVLKRLRGTPLPLGYYLAGRIGAAAGISLLTLVVMFGVGIAFFDVSLPAAAVLPSLLAFGVGTACFTALGQALAVLARSARTVSSVALGTLLPLAFVSDIFLIGSGLPAPLSAIGWTFPLRHFANAAFEAGLPGAAASGQWWLHLAVMVVWGLLGAAVTWRHPRVGAES